LAAAGVGIGCAMRGSVRRPKRFSPYFMSHLRGLNIREATYTFRATRLAIACFSYEKRIAARSHALTGIVALRLQADG
jgi:hypothetical protein